MSDAWYYSHAKNKIGPFTQQELKDLAASGEIGTDDTVWKEGVEQGFAAGRITNLFAAPIAPPPQEGEPMENATRDSESAMVSDDLPPAEKAAAVPGKRKQGRAVALKGADIINQDGERAKFRMKCTECGHKDSSTHSVLITNKVMKKGFYCAKCKKRRESVIQCFAG